MISALSPTTYSDSPIEETVHAAQRGDRKAFGRLVERYERPSTPRCIGGCTTMPRPRSCARTCSSRRCARSTNSKTRVASGAGCARSRHAWPSTARCGVGRRWRLQPMVLENACVEAETPLARLVRERREQVHQGLRRLRAGPANANRLLRRGQQPAGNERALASPVGTIKRRLHVARKRLARELEALG